MLKNKKVFLLILALIVVSSVMAGCNNAPAQESSVAPSSTAPTDPTVPIAPEEIGDTDWPKRSIELVIPFAPGGDTDFYGRTYAKYLEQELGVTVTAINVEGAGGTVGAQNVLDSANDGYRMLFYHTGNLYTNKLLGASDIDHTYFDVAAIGVLDNTNVLVASAGAGITDAEDFLEKVRANPGELNVGTTISGFSYFTVCKMEAAGNFQLNAVDMGGASAMVPALLGDQIELAANSYGVFKQYIENGDIIALMTTGDKRNPNFPDVPTTTELGMENSVAMRAYFLAFPKGTDAAIVKKLSDAVGAIQNNPDYASDIREAYYVEPFYVPYNEVIAYMEDMWANMEPYKDMLTQAK